MTTSSQALQRGEPRSASVPEIWLVLPTYNEAENVEQVVQLALEALPPHAHVLIVDDNSPDGTGQLADQIAEGETAVEVLHRPTRDGLGQAYLNGFTHALQAGADVLCQMDADFSHDPHALPELLARLSDADVVLGSRYVAGGRVEDWGAIRRVISRGGSWYARRILGVPLRDLTGGFKAFRRDAVASLVAAEIAAQGYVFQIEMTYRAWRAGRSIVEVPIVFRDRKAGSSKMSLGIAIEAVWRVPWMRWRLRRNR